MTAKLELNYCTLGSFPPTPTPGHPLVRPLIEFVMADLGRYRWPLHWSACLYSWNSHIRRTRCLAPYDGDLFWGRLRQALERQLITVTWDEEWAAL
jgi:hypothetical protein